MGGVIVDVYVCAFAHVGKFGREQSSAVRFFSEFPISPTPILPIPILPTNQLSVPFCLQGVKW